MTYYKTWKRRAERVGWTCEAHQRSKLTGIWRDLWSIQDKIDGTVCRLELLTLPNKDGTAGRVLLVERDGKPITAIAAHRI